MGTRRRNGGTVPAGGPAGVAPVPELELRRVPGARAPLPGPPRRMGRGRGRAGGRSQALSGALSGALAASRPATPGPAAGAGQGAPEPGDAARPAGAGADREAAAVEPHILVIDDDRRIRELLRRFLARNGYLVTTARDTAQADRLVGGLAFDLMVVDVMMPGEDGISFTGRMRARTATPILLLTARSETGDRIVGLEAGADDYLAKPFEPRELLLRIAAILRRAAPAPPPPAAPRVLVLGSVAFDLGRAELRRGEETVRLTTTEQALMRLLARTPNEPVSRTRLAEVLGGPASAVQERAVDVQVTRLRRKIERDPRNPRYLRTVRGAGYMLTPD